MGIQLWFISNELQIFTRITNQPYFKAQTVAFPDKEEALERYVDALYLFTVTKYRVTKYTQKQSTEFL